MIMLSNDAASTAVDKIYAVISKYIESGANLMLKRESSCKNSPGTKFSKWFGWWEFGVYGD